MPAAKLRLTARTLLLGDRIDTAGLERSDLIATTPLAFRSGATGYAVLFRYGVAVLVGLSPVEEDEVVRALGPRLAGRYAPIEDESTVVEITPDQDDQVVPGGPVAVRALTPPRLLVIADVLAKNAALSRDEREVGKVLEVMEPFAAALARTGKTPSNRRQMLKTIGQALQVQHRLAGRVEIEDKPDILWDQPEFERLWLRLADEYELKERATSLARKLAVIDDTAHALTEIIDTERGVRLEMTIILLIVVEVLVTFYELFVRGGH
ncbi:RMD1 family protein [Rhodoplanes sp. TEM]|uniref:RMD1 family protein n=1 Tax=Rhodoplanes tepidamans TaxID=200616 RepID=A0ABT5JEQ1_RHOTP|nr:MULTISPECIES: RMD1 family protein [Rhodoplanes]MDC7788158.1 RMD1 family protein [Rhodoplanes tepidamans]MDC7987250.1 RMD1 family protein [Rhodoplanes sp. TEM]MDQ0355152.1 putative Rmd1/YagE family protein [Rhodoplanes tepidamans]